MNPMNKKELIAAVNDKGKARTGPVILRSARPGRFSDEAIQSAVEAVQAVQGELRMYMRGGGDARRETIVSSKATPRVRLRAG